MYFDLTIPIKGNLNWKVVEDAISFSFGSANPLSEDIDELRYADTYRRDSVRSRIICIDISHRSYVVLFFKGDDILDIHIEKRSKSISNPEFIEATNRFLKRLRSETNHIRKHLGNASGKLYDSDGNYLLFYFSKNFFREFWARFWRLSFLGYEIVSALGVAIYLRVTKHSTGIMDSVNAILFVGILQAVILFFASLIRTYTKQYSIELKEE